MYGFWKLLEIEPTSDLKKIKQAYAKQTKRYHPEDSPQEFQALQEAYKNALAWAKKNKQPKTPHSDLGTLAPNFENKEPVSSLELGQDQTDPSLSGHPHQAEQSEENLGPIHINETHTPSEGDEEKTNAPVEGIELGQDQNLTPPSGPLHQTEHSEENLGPIHINETEQRTSPEGKKEKAGNSVFNDGDLSADYQAYIAMLNQMRLWGLQGFFLKDLTNLIRQDYFKRFWQIPVLKEEILSILNVSTFLMSDDTEFKTTRKVLQQMGFPEISNLLTEVRTNQVIKAAPYIAPTQRPVEKTYKLVKQEKERKQLPWAILFACLSIGLFVIFPMSSRFSKPQEDYTPEYMRSLPTYDVEKGAEIVRKVLPMSLTEINEKLTTLELSLTDDTDTYQLKSKENPDDLRGTYQHVRLLTDKSLVILSSYSPNRIDILDLSAENLINTNYQNVYEVTLIENGEKKTGSYLAVSETGSDWKLADNKLTIISPIAGEWQWQNTVVLKDGAAEFSKEE